jgi:hypothetical protein
LSEDQRFILVRYPHTAIELDIECQETQNLSIRSTTITPGNVMEMLETQFLPHPGAQPKNNGFSTALDVLINPCIFTVNFCITKVRLLSYSRHKNKACPRVKGLSTLLNLISEEVNNRTLLEIPALNPSFFSNTWRRNNEMLNCYENLMNIAVLTCYTHTRARARTHTHTHTPRIQKVQKSVAHTPSLSQPVAVPGDGCIV